MGGVGYVMAIYVLAYRLIGPHLWTLRLVSLAASVLAVAGLATLTRRWYGSAAAFATLAVTPALSVFQLTNSIRLDIVVVAFVAWTLVLYTAVHQRPAPRGHFLIGLILAIGLEVHLHTAAAAFAVGFAYLVDAVRNMRSRSAAGGLFRRPIVGFVSGYAIGAMLFLAANVLPNPTGFVRTAALARLSAADSGPQLDLTARMNGSRLTQTFLSPTLIATKEISRYGQLLRALPWWERALWACALLMFILRPGTPAGIDGRVLLLGALLGGGIVFNGPSAVYFSAILAFFVPAAGLFLVRGLGAGGRHDWRRAGFASVVAIALVAGLTVPRTLGRTAASARQTISPPPAVATAVTHLASSSCVLAGPTDLYAQFFMAYPRFVGTRRVETMIGSTYYDLQDALPRYWLAKNPDFVFGDVDDGLSTFLRDAKYVRVADAVWQKPDGLSAGCPAAIGPSEPGTDRRP
jgi:hypothetical protein